MSDRNDNDNAIKKTTTVQDSDVIFDRKNFKNCSLEAYGGDGFFTELVTAKRHEYVEAGKKEKRVIAQLIVADVKSRGGRFLRLVKGHWEVCSDRLAQEKTRKTLASTGAQYLLSQPKEPIPLPFHDKSSLDAFISRFDACWKEYMERTQSQVNNDIATINVVSITCDDDDDDDSINGESVGLPLKSLDLDDRSIATDISAVVKNELLHLDVDDSFEFNQNVHYSIPENGVCFKVRRLHKNLPGITGQYRNRRDGLFGTTMRRIADRTVTNDYIDKAIIDHLKLRCRLPEIRFFDYVEADGCYKEIFGDTMYQAMQDDIMNKKYKYESPTNEETPGKKAPRKKAPPGPKSDVIPTSASSTGCMLSDLISSKRMLLNKMQRDLKVSLYEQMIWDVSHVLSSRNLNEEKTKEEMYTWLYCTWHHFFENNSEQNMNILTVSSSESNDDGDSSGNGRSRPPDNHKKRKGNPKDDKDNEYDDDEYDPASNDCSGNAKRCADGTIYLDECNDIETSGYMEFCAKHFVNVEPHQYMIQVC